MFKFTLTSVLLLIAIAMVDCSDSFGVHLMDTSDEYHLTERKHQMNEHMEHEFSIENFRLENGKENSLVSKFQ